MYATAGRNGLGCARCGTGLGAALEDIAEDYTGEYDQDPQLRQLHQLALLVLALRENFSTYLNGVENSDPDYDPALLPAIGQQLQYYVQQFAALRAQIDHTTATANALSRADQAILDIGTWAQQTIAALPNALAAIPNAAIDALAKVAENAGRNVAKSLAWPAVIVGGALIGVLLFVQQAERTRSGRALARHL